MTRHAFLALSRLGRFILVTVLLAALVLTGSPNIAYAASSFTFFWETNAWVESSSDWNGSGLYAQEGFGHFIANETALPTRTVPGEFKRGYFLKHCTSGTRMPTTRNLFAAPLDAPLGILRLRRNTIKFVYGPLQARGTTHDKMYVTGSNIGTVQFWRLVHSNGDVYHWYGTDDNTPTAGRCDGDEMDPSGITAPLDLSLEQLNPELANHIKALEAAMGQDADTLVQNASQLPNLAVQLAHLEQLRNDVANLLERGLDEDTATALDALLSQYSEVPPATREALVKVIIDLHQAIADLQTEMGRITGDFGKQVDSVVGTVEAILRTEGFNPDDPATYAMGFDASMVPAVAVPDISQAIPFDRTHDAFAADADQIIAKLSKYVAGTDVVDRQTFIGLVSGWRNNQKVLENVLRVRGYPVDETNAFNTARNRVTTYLQAYLDGQDWFTNSPVPAQTKSLIDVILAHHYPEIAAEIKDALNEWRGRALLPQQQGAVDTVNALAQGSPALVEEDDETRARYIAALRSIAVGIKTGIRIGVGFVPVAGDLLDVCEAITGFEFCTSTGTKLGDGDRVYSALGSIGGSGPLWRMVANGTTFAGAAVLQRVARVADVLADLPAGERKTLLKRLGRAVNDLGDLSGKEIKRLADKFGDLTMMQLGPVLKGKGMQELEELKFFTMTPAIQATLTRNGAAARALPPFGGMKAADIRAVFAKDRGWRALSNTPTQEVWGHADGSIVRMAPNGAGARRPGPNVKKEISHNALQFTPADIACKVTDVGGVPVPAGSGGAKSGVMTWFQRKVGRQPAGIEDDESTELGMLLKVWADATHPNYVP